MQSNQTFGASYHQVVELFRSNLLLIVPQDVLHIRGQQLRERKTWTNQHNVLMQKPSSCVQSNNLFLNHRLASLAYLFDSQVVLTLDQREPKVFGHIFLLSEGLTESGRSIAATRLLCAINQLSIDDTAAQMRLAPSALAVYFDPNEISQTNNNNSQNGSIKHFQPSDVKSLGWLMVYGLPFGSSNQLVEAILARLGSPVRPIDVAPLDVAIGGKASVLVRDVFQPVQGVMKQKLASAGLRGAELWLKPQPLLLQQQQQQTLENDPIRDIVRHASVGNPTELDSVIDLDNDVTMSTAPLPDSSGYGPEFYSENAENAIYIDAAALPRRTNFVPVPTFGPTDLRNYLSRRAMRMQQPPPPPPRWRPVRPAVSVFDRLGPRRSDGSSAQCPIVID